MKIGRPAAVKKEKDLTELAFKLVQAEQFLPGQLLERKVNILVTKTVYH